MTTTTTAVNVGGVCIGLRTSSARYVDLLHERFAGYIEPSSRPDYEFEVELVEPREDAPDRDVRVYREGGHWRIERGDFEAALDPVSRRGRIRQDANPYSVDSLLRIVHTLALAPQGGFLLHASSAVRHGRAHVFAGVSGAGKTTMARLAPPDALVMTDEVSCLRREGRGYVAHGTPFAGELARPGANVSAPVEAIYMLKHGRENRVAALEPAQAARALLSTILFFAEDPALVRQVFASALELVERMPVRRLAFVPEAGAWDLI